MCTDGQNQKFSHSKYFRVILMKNFHKKIVIFNFEIEEFETCLQHMEVSIAFIRSRVFSLYEKRKCWILKKMFGWKTYLGLRFLKIFTSKKLPPICWVDGWKNFKILKSSHVVIMSHGWWIKGHHVLSQSNWTLLYTPCGRRTDPKSQTISKKSWILKIRAEPIAKIVCSRGQYWATTNVGAQYCLGAYYFCDGRGRG